MIFWNLCLRLQTNGNVILFDVTTICNIYALRALQDQNTVDCGWWLMCITFLRIFWFVGSIYFDFVRHLFFVAALAQWTIFIWTVVTLHTWYIGVLKKDAIDLTLTPHAIKASEDEWKWFNRCLRNEIKWCPSMSQASLESRYMSAHQVIEICNNRF